MMWLGKKVVADPGSCVGLAKSRGVVEVGAEANGLLVSAAWGLVDMASAKDFGTQAS